MQTGLLIDARSFLGKVWKLTAPYWRSEEKWVARALLAAIVAISLFLVYMLVLFNDWNRQFFNALENKDGEAFFALLLYFCFLAAVFIVASIYETYLEQMLQMRWRIWLTQQYLGHWMAGQAYYRLELDHHGTDNPDQRIAEDLRLFTTNTLSLSLGLLREAVTLATFVVILWNVSDALPLRFGDLEVNIPGYLVWAALLYSILGSILTHFVGRRLITLNFQQERYEADLRYGLVRLRENAEGIALYRGEAPERGAILSRIERLRQNWWQLMEYTKRLGAFTIGYNQIAIVFPYFVAGGRFFSGAITLGDLTRITNAFDRVQTSLSWFVNNYGALANWKASVDRLLTFQSALAVLAGERRHGTGIDVGADAGADLRASGLELGLPSGRTIVARASFEIAPRERVVVTGPSGIGKSTLFRALAGIWPYGGGTVRFPEGARRLFLPQKPYIPLAALRDAIAYPAEGSAFTDDSVREALGAVGLAPLASRLDELQNWSLALSGGEQQRLAIARALLHRPAWLFLDEATSSLDEDAERQLYALLRERLPDTAIVSIAHRPGVAAFHERRLQLVNGETAAAVTA